MALAWRDRIRAILVLNGGGDNFVKRGTKSLNSQFNQIKSLYEYHKPLGNELDFVRKNNHNTIEYWVKPREKLMVDTNFIDLHTSGTSGIKAIFENEVIFNNPKNNPHFKIKVVLKFYQNNTEREVAKEYKPH